MADWRALAYGIQHGAEFGEKRRQRRGRELYGQVATGQGQGIPMPGQEGAAPAGPEGEAAPAGEGPSLQADLSNLAEAFALGGIDEDTFHTGVQNLGMRTYVNAKKAWDQFSNSTDPETRQRALQEIMYSLPNAGKNYVVALEDGRFATVPHDDEGNPIEEAEGLMLDDQMVNSIMAEATSDPDNWMRYVGMSTLDMAELRYKEAQTGAVEGGERRAEEMHPLKMESEEALIGQRKASTAASYASAAASKAGAGGAWKPKDALAAIERYYDAQLDSLSASTDLMLDRGGQEAYDQKAQQIMREKNAAMAFLRQTGDPQQAILAAAGGGVSPVSTAGEGRAAGGKLIPVQTPEEARALPSGTRIQLPDGTPGVVP